MPTGPNTNLKERVSSDSALKFVKSCWDHAGPGHLSPQEKWGCSFGNLMSCGCHTLELGWLLQEATNWLDAGTKRAWMGLFPLLHSCGEPVGEVTASSALVATSMVMGGQVDTRASMWGSDCSWGTWEKEVALGADGQPLFSSRGRGWATRPHPLTRLSPYPPPLHLI